MKDERGRERERERERTKGRKTEEERERERETEQTRGKYCLTEACRELAESLVTRERMTRERMTTKERKTKLGARRWSPPPPLWGWGGLGSVSQ